MIRVGGSPWAINQAAVLQVLRHRGATTRPELERVTGLGRKIISERVQELLDLQLVAEGDFARSTGGRMPRQIAFRPDRGLVGVAEMNVDKVTVGLTDLSGTVRSLRELDLRVDAGPDGVFDGIERTLRELVADEGRGQDAVWGIGVGVTAPVDLSAGRILPGQLFDGTPMTGWDGYPVRERLADALACGVWVDNEVNLMALGELRAGRARGYTDVFFAKLGPSIGGGLVMGGQLQRGAAAAGELGHLAVPGDEPRPCWCGGTGCLFTFVGREYLLAEAEAVARAGESPVLAERLEAGVTLADLVAAASHDPAAEQILRRAGSRTGAVLATVVNLLDPSLLLIGGELAGSADIVLDQIRTEIDARAMSVATRSLELAHSPLSDRAGLVGAAYMVSDALFAPDALSIWLEAGHPAGLGRTLEECSAS